MSKMEVFNLPNKCLLKNDLVEIVDNYKVLHFDDFPILFIGTNKFGNKIIGSHLEEDDDNLRIYTLHTILTDKEYYHFLNGKISYLEILKESTSISLVEKDFNFKILKAFDFDFNSIPTDYLPLESSFCPKIVKEQSLEYAISLKGKLADVNKADTEQVSKIQNGFAEFLEDRVKSFKGLFVTPKTMLQAYATGSFIINLELDLSSKNNQIDLFPDLAPLDKYLCDYIKYISSGFSEDKELFKSNTPVSSYKFKELENSMINVYNSSNIKKPDNAYTHLKADVLKSIGKFEKISEQVGEDFDSIQILNIVSDDESPLAFIDKEISEIFQNSIEEIELSQTCGYSIDDQLQEYSIYIYHLNTDTRIGNALIKNLGNESVMSKPKIKIEGDEGLEQTKYTESLYLNKWINVKAKAKKVGEKFTYLDIAFEKD